jgi:regulator of nonsense transcripts 1
MATPYSLNLLSNFNWDDKPPWLKDLFFPKQTIEAIQDQLALRCFRELEEIMSFCLEYHVEDQLFCAFNMMISTHPLPDGVQAWVDRFPPLAFSLLKMYPPDESRSLKPEVAAMGGTIIRNIIRSANNLGIASLVALEKISVTISQIPMPNYMDLLMLTAHCIHSSNLTQEVLLVLNDAREPIISQSDIHWYIHKHALAVAFDRAEEAADECPCDERGTPAKRLSAVPILKLLPVANESATVVAHVRIDAPNAVRLHSHVRLQVATQPDKGQVDCPVIDGIVIQASKGELKIELQYPPPPEMVKMQWKMYPAGSVGGSLSISVPRKL